MSAVKRERASTASAPALFGRAHRGDVFDASQKHITGIRRVAAADLSAAIHSRQGWRHY